MQKHVGKQGRGASTPGKIIDFDFVCAGVSSVECLQKEMPVAISVVSL